LAEVDTGETMTKVQGAFDAIVEAYATQAAALGAELQAMEEQYDEKA